jgi:hypothetical protein
VRDARLPICRGIGSCGFLFVAPKKWEVLSFAANI